MELIIIVVVMLIQTAIILWLDNQNRELKDQIETARKWQARSDRAWRMRNITDA